MELAHGVNNLVSPHQKKEGTVTETGSPERHSASHRSQKPSVHEKACCGVGRRWKRGVRGAGPEVRVSCKCLYWVGRFLTVAQACSTFAGRNEGAKARAAPSSQVALPCPRVIQGWISPSFTTICVVKDSYTSLALTCKHNLNRLLKPFSQSNTWSSWWFRISSKLSKSFWRWT